MATVAGKPNRSRESRESTHSGRLLLRMPRELHAQLAARADAAGSSLNQYIVETLTRGLDGGSVPDGAAEPRRVPRSLRVALLVNALVVALAAATCVVLLLVAWRT
jgi:HicB-like protein involved in pilus formation